jgi:hypothetical protein
LIGIIVVEEKGKELVRYFTDEKAADAAISDRGSQDALAVLAHGVTFIGMRQSKPLIKSTTRASPPHRSSSEAQFTGYWNTHLIHFFE